MRLSGSKANSELSVRLLGTSYGAVEDSVAVSVVQLESNWGEKQK